MRQKNKKIVLTGLSFLLAIQVTIAGLLPFIPAHETEHHHCRHHTSEQASSCPSDTHSGDVQDEDRTSHTQHCHDCDYCQCACFHNSIIIHEPQTLRFFLKEQGKLFIFQKSYSCEYLPKIEYPPISA